MKGILLIPNHYIVSDSEVLTMEVAEVELVKALQTRFGKVSIAAFQGFTTYDSLRGRLRRSAVTFYRLNIFSCHRWLFQKLINYALAITILAVALSRHQWIYIFFPSPSAVIAAFSAIILRRPYGLYVRGTWMAEDGSTPLVWRVVLSHADFIVATGEAFRKKIQVFNRNVHNEVPLTKLRVATLGEEIARRTVCIKRILFVGHLSESKGVLDLIRALSLVRNDLKLDIVIDFVGGALAEENAIVRKLAIECGIERYISLFGHLTDHEELKRRYAIADAFAFPSFYREGFPRVLYEAMMHGLPIITTEMPGIAGFLRNGQNCLYCKAKNPRDIARCIEQFVRDPAFAVKLGLAGYEEVAELFKGFKHQGHADQVISLAETCFDRSVNLQHSKQ